MDYSEAQSTCEEQADSLICLGLLADRAELAFRLETVGRHRLEGYLHPFRCPPQGSEVPRFAEGATFTAVWERYCFDRRLRVLVLDAIERVEVSLRARLVSLFSRRYGPFGYCNEATLPKLPPEKYLEWRSALLQETQRSKEPFKKEFFDKYSNRNLPLGLLAELMSMGSLLTFLNGVEPFLKREVADAYGLADEVLISWFRSLNAARNLCAHHARFWNRVLGYAPLLPNPRKFHLWHEPQKLRTDRSGIILFICRYWLRTTSPTSLWHQRVEALFAEYPAISPTLLGLPEGWRWHPLWK